MYTYEHGHIVHHCRAGAVTIPDQVAGNMALWDRADMPFPALDRDGNPVVILLGDTDA